METDPRVSAAIGVGDSGQAIDHKVTGSKFSIACLDAADGVDELNLDAYLRNKRGYEILRTENILRQMLHDVKHTARDLKTGAIAYHARPMLDDRKLLLLTYIREKFAGEIGRRKGYPCQFD